MIDEDDKAICEACGECEILRYNNFADECLCEYCYERADSKINHLMDDAYDYEDYEGEPKDQ